MKEISSDIGQRADVTPPDSAIPWEVEGSFFQTVRELLRHPYAVASRFPVGAFKAAATYYLLVQAISIVATVLTIMSTNGTSGLLDVVGNEVDKAFWLLALTALFGLVIHVGARHSGSDARLSDACRVVAYAASGYLLLRLAVLPVFALGLDRSRFGGLITFALWVGPLAFACWFAVTAIRHRYKRSYAMAILSVVGVPLVLCTVVALFWNTFR